MVYSFPSHTMIEFGVDNSVKQNIPIVMTCFIWYMGTIWRNVLFDTWVASCKKQGLKYNLTLKLIGLYNDTMAIHIKRTLYNKASQHLKQPEITLIVGPRQAGKTTLIKQMQNECGALGKQTMYLNLDIESDFSLLRSQDAFLFSLKNHVGDSHAYVFIDEFQRKEDGGRFLKGLYDMGLPYKFIITGSGSMELKERVHESLAGRKHMLEMSTLTFAEYVHHQTAYQFEHDLATYAALYPERAHLYLRNYLTFGGYPKLVLADSIDEKRVVLQEIYSSYLVRDITVLLNIEKTAAFQKLVESLSILDGKLVNISTLSKHIGISMQTVEKYLWYLEKTFAISCVRPFSENPSREINKAYTYYFNDIGLKNLISAQFDLPADRVDLGFDFQNFVFLELRHLVRDRQPLSIHFWRTNDGAEVDFVLKQGKKLIGIECKYVDYTEPEYTRSMRSFIAKYRPDRFYIVNLSYEDTHCIDGVPVTFIPYYRMGEIANGL